MSEEIPNRNTRAAQLRRWVKPYMDLAEWAREDQREDEKMDDESANGEGERTPTLNQPAKWLRVSAKEAAEWRSMRAYGMPVRQIAEKTGRAHSTVQRWTKGVGRPPGRPPRSLRGGLELEDAKRLGAQSGDIEDPPARPAEPEDQVGDDDRQWTRGGVIPLRPDNPPNGPAVGLPALGVRLRALRVSLGLKLIDVEARTGISNAYLSQLELGRRERPGVAVLCKLAKVYGVAGRELVPELWEPNELPGLDDGGSGDGGLDEGELRALVKLISDHGHELSVRDLPLGFALRVAAYVARNMAPSLGGRA